MSRHILCIGLATLAVAGCGLRDGGEDGDTTGGVTTTSAPVPEDRESPRLGDVTVLDAAFGTEVDEERKAVGIVGSVFPPDTKRIHAVLVLEGPEPGDVVTGRWFKLDGESAPPDGALISEAGIELAADTVGANAISRVALNLTAAGDALAPGEWLVRVYLNEDLIRTMAFIVVPGEEPSPTPQSPPPAVGATEPAGSTASATPVAETTATPQPGATPTVGAASSYTVQPGDTLTLIAEGVKPADESTASYVARLMETNGLTAATVLFVGQVLTLPGPP